MTDQYVQIAASDWRAVIDPAHGCVVRSLTRAEQPILRQAPQDSCDPLLAACYPCVPWFGRLNRDVEWNGRHYKIGPTHLQCDPDHALHGFGWICAWNIVSISSNALTCDLEVYPKENASPFAFTARLTYALDKAGLTVSLTICNDEKTAIPVGLGLHPFFYRSDDTRLTFPAHKIWTPPDGDNGESTALRDIDDFSTGKSLPNITIDHSYPESGADAKIQTGNTIIQLRSDAPHLHLYAPHAEQFFCVEPITNLPGQYGITKLAPGDAHSIKMQIHAI